MKSDLVVASQHEFQWSHFFSEMDRSDSILMAISWNMGFNGATSFQKWIESK